MRPIRVIALVVAAWILGGSTPEVEARGSLKITFTTGPTPNLQFAPNNVVAVWIQNQGGTFVKTVGTWFEIRGAYLLAWQAASGGSTIDAVSGASRANHAQPLTVIWNLRDLQGNTIPDGTYTIRLEASESNATAQGQNNQGTFTFVKGATPSTQTNLSNGGFTNVSLEFNPNAVTCGDGTADAPEEKCDLTIGAGKPGACPAACATEDACMPVQLQGIADLCSAECVALPAITACVNGDGCCAPGCTELNDDDCGGGGSPEATGGCETGGSGTGTGGALALGLGTLGLALLIRRRRR